ncbi:MAG: hypothetical protein ACLR4Z_15180 [Butyricicoccaceae bacterium]
MLDCLQNVTAHGTAYGIQIDGVETAGKTGTTSSNTDIWFCGVTPEYSAAVWVGYEHNYRLDGLYGRNGGGDLAQRSWRRCMRVIPVWSLIRIRRIRRGSHLLHGYRPAGIRRAARQGRASDRPLLEGQGSDARPAAMRTSKTSTISRAMRHR